MSTDNKYTPEFVDQSWEQMNELLDKEMPVKKKRRFPFFFLMAAIMLLIVAYFAYSLFINKSDVPVLIAQQKTSLAKPHENNTSSAATVTTEEIISEKSDPKTPLPLVAEGKTNSFNAVRNTKGSTYRNNVVNENAKEEITSILPDNKNKASTVNASQDATQPFVSTPQNLIQNSTTSKNAQAIVLKNTFIDNTEDVSNESSFITASLSSLQISVPFLKTNQRILPGLNVNVSTPIEVVKEWDRWSFRIGGAYASNFKRTIHGSGLQLRTDFNLSPSWSLEGGLAGFYHHSFNEQITSEETADAIFQDDESSNIPSGIVNSAEEDAKANRISNYVSNIKSQIQLNTTIGIKKTFNSDFFLSIGAKYRYTMSRKLDSVLDPLLADMEESFDQTETNSYFRNHFISPYVGIGYHFSDHLGIRIDADFSSISYFSDAASNFLETRTSFLQGEVAYRF